MPCPQISAHQIRHGKLPKDFSRETFVTEVETTGRGGVVNDTVLPHNRVLVRRVSSKTLQRTSSGVVPELKNIKGEVVARNVRLTKNKVQMVLVTKRRER